MDHQARIIDLYNESRGRVVLSSAVLLAMIVLHISMVSYSALLVSVFPIDQSEDILLNYYKQQSVQACSGQEGMLRSLRSFSDAARYGNDEERACINALVAKGKRENFLSGLKLFFVSLITFYFTFRYRKHLDAFKATAFFHSEEFGVVKFTEYHLPALLSGISGFLSFWGLIGGLFFVFVADRFLFG